MEDFLAAETPVRLGAWAVMPGVTPLGQEKSPQHPRLTSRPARDTAIGEVAPTFNMPPQHFGEPSEVPTEGRSPNLSPPEYLSNPETWSGCLELGLCFYCGHFGQMHERVL